MASLSSPGIGSGLDVKGIVGQLVELERRPVASMQKQQETLQAKLSAFGLLQSYTVNIRDAVGRLTSPALWEAVKATSSDSSSLTATAQADAAAGSYSVKVNQLAQAHAIKSGTYTSSSTPVTTAGTLTIKTGSYDMGVPAFTEASSKVITVEAGDTLADVRDAINTAPTSVIASIINDGSFARLIIRSKETGLENSIQVTGDVDPASLNYDPVTNTRTSAQTQAALDAEIEVDGLAISSASNAFTNVLDGVTFNAVKVTTSPVKVTVATDTAAMRSAVDDFIKAYNDINKYIRDQTAYNADTKVSATLQGDAPTVALLNQLRSAIGLTSGASPSYARLSDLGVEMQRDGSLKLDSTKFGDAVENTEQVQAAFTADAAGTANDGFAVRLKALTTALSETDGLINSRSNGLRERIRKVEKDIARFEDRVAATEARLLRQYGSLDSSLGRISQLNAFVTQQITNWNKSKG